MIDPHLPLPAPSRMFFALWPAEPVSTAIMDARAALPGPTGRVSHRLDLHLTLVFVGTVATELQPCVMAAGDGLAVEPFSLTLTEIGDWGHPRIRWCRPTHVPPALLGLVDSLRGRLRDCGITPEARPYRPHVTLARKAGALPVTTLANPIDWPVTEFVLAASRAGLRPRYEILKRWGTNEQGGARRAEDDRPDDPR